MRSIALAFVFFIAFSGKAQVEQAFCDKNAPKLSFQGKAPSIWAIDGNTKDWQTILGPLTPGSNKPYNPPATSAFNWSADSGAYFNDDMDNNQPDQDLTFLSFIHDDYNVYFYFRRKTNGNSVNTFYFFVM